MVRAGLCRTGSIVGETPGCSTACCSACRDDLDWDRHFVDATVVRAYKHAAGARRLGAIGGEGTVASAGDALGRSQGIST